MIASWRWKVRHAEQACDDGRLDEACQALADQELRQFEPAQRLVTKLTGRLLARIRQRLVARDWRGAWRDLAKARTLAGETTEVLELRYQLMTLEPPTAAWQSPTAVADETPRVERKNMSVSLLQGRFLLWIDAVGGFLICPSRQVVLGQALAGNRVDVAIQGDLSRRHATLTRHGEGYVLEPISPTRIGRHWINEPTLLADGDEFWLGNSVQLRFRQPNVLSASARLEVLSRHRTQPAADAIVLFAESCVLGPSAQSHVVCRPWFNDLVLFRQEQRLCCRAMSPFELNGKPCTGLGNLDGAARIVGEDFTVSIEQL